MATEIAQPVPNGKVGVPDFVNVAERVSYLDSVFSGDLPANGGEVSTDNPEFQRQMMRPAGIKEDVKFMEQRGRVNFILRSNFFRDELEQIIDDQIRCGNAPGSLLMIEQLADALRLPFVSSAQLPSSPPLSTAVGGSFNVVPINDIRGPAATATESPFGRIERIQRCKLASAARILDLHGFSTGIQALLTARLTIPEKAAATATPAATEKPAEEKEKPADEADANANAAPPTPTPPATATATAVDAAADSVSVSAEPALLVNPLGLMLQEVTASSLQKLSFPASGQCFDEGAMRVVDRGSTRLPQNLTQTRVHAAILAARPDLNAVFYLNAPAAVAVAAMRDGLLPISQEAMIAGSKEHISYHVPTGIVQSNAQLDAIARDLGPTNKVLFVRNSGALVCGATIEEALHFAFNLIPACSLQLDMSACPMENVMMPPPSATAITFEVGSRGASGNDHLSMQSSQTTTTTATATGTGTTNEKPAIKWGLGELEFEAYMRHLDNNGFRTGYPYRQPAVRATTSRAPTGAELPASTTSTLPAEFYDLEISDKPRSKPASAYLMKHSTWNEAMMMRMPTSPTYTPGMTLDRGATLPPGAYMTGTMRTGTLPSGASTLRYGTLPPGMAAPGAHPKELKDNFKKVKDNYYKDTRSSGPQSRILEGVTWDEAAAMRAAGDPNAPTVSAASKAILQRDAQPSAFIFKGYKKRNPFEVVTDADLEAYRREVDRKLRGEPEPSEQLSPEARSKTLPASFSSPMSVSIPTPSPPLTPSPPVAANKSREAQAPLLVAHRDAREMSARSSATAPRSIIKGRPETQPYANVSVTDGGASLQRSESERVRAPAMQLVDLSFDDDRKTRTLDRPESATKPEPPPPVTPPAVAANVQVGVTASRTLPEQMAPVEVTSLEEKKTKKSFFSSFSKKKDKKEKK